MNALNISKENKLKRVNRFEAIEIKKEIGRIFFPSLNNFIEMSLNLWYLPNRDKEMGIPIIAEFAFDYKSKTLDLDNNNSPIEKSIYLEEFPLPLVNIANSFFYSLQEDEFMSSNQKVKTRTEFVYEYIRK